MKSILLILFSSFFMACALSGSSFPKLSQTEIDELLKKLKSYPGEPYEEGEIAIMKTTLGTIKIKFWPDVAPGHVDNFKRLANFGYYDGTIFHRIIPGFMIQGGDIKTRDDNPGNDGTGNPGYSIPAEFNDRDHKRGVLSMARSQNPNSAGSQFFICHDRASNLNGQYTAFGEVIEGIDVVDKIATAEIDPAVPPGTRPLEDIVLISVRVEKE